MNDTITARIDSLRSFMIKNGLSAYITFSTDPHSGEYVPAHWESRKWITGFTGSAGTAVITEHDGGVWTDSRYFLQAEQQLRESGLKLFKERMPHTPSISEWLVSILRKGDKIGFDGYTTPLSVVQELRGELSNMGLELTMVEDPYIYIWKDRPEIPNHKVFVLDEKYSGAGTDIKLSQIRDRLSLNDNDAILLSSLDEIAWTLNMRGKDIHCNPLFVSYLLILKESAILYINKDKLPDHIILYLESYNVNIEEYGDVESSITSLNNYNILMPPNINFALYNAAAKQNNVHITNSPICDLKSIKNETEISGFRTAMVRDGIAMVRFLMWLQKSIGSENLTETSVDRQLYKFRSEMELFQGISFDTIAGYQEHGAIVHYEATEDTASTLKPEGLLLLDSGAQYLDGTTDITRTIPLGPVSLSQKRDYTLVLKGFIGLAMAEFPEGTCGTQLDVLARAAMWKEGINYGHGTGHGVGHFLNVHEGPQQIRMNNVPTTLKPGMTITNEPGIYRDGKYGIRTENTMLIIQGKETEFGKFYKFEQLTLCPIYKSPIILEMLSSKEISWLNDYHKMVKARLSPYLTDEEKEWLTKMTSPIQK